MGSPGGDAANNLMNSLNQIMANRNIWKQQEKDRQESLRRFQLQQKAQEEQKLFQQTATIGDGYLKLYDGASTPAQEKLILEKWNKVKSGLDPKLVQLFDDRYSTTPFGPIAERTRISDQFHGKVKPNTIDPKKAPVAWATLDKQNRRLTNQKKSFIHGLPAPVLPSVEVQLVGDEMCYIKEAQDGSITVVKVGEEDAAAAAEKYNMTLNQINSGVKKHLSTRQQNTDEGIMNVSTFLDPLTDKPTVTWEKSTDFKMADTRSAKGETVNDELSKDAKKFLISFGTDDPDAQKKHSARNLFNKRKNDLLDSGRFKEGMEAEFEAELAVSMKDIFPNTVFTILGKNELSDPWVYGAPTYHEANGFGMIGVPGQETEFKRGDGSTVIWAHNAATDTVRDRYGNVMGSTLEEAQERAMQMGAPKTQTKTTGIKKPKKDSMLQKYWDKKKVTKEKPKDKKKSQSNKDQRIRDYWEKSDKADGDWERFKTDFSNYLKDTYGIGAKKRHYADLPGEK